MIICYKIVPVAHKSFRFSSNDDDDKDDSHDINDDNEDDDDNESNQELDEHNVKECFNKNIKNCRKCWSYVFQRI